MRRIRKVNISRRERYAGSLSRSFYVGEHITEADIHPKYENGILSFFVPKAKEQAGRREKAIIFPSSNCKIVDVSIRYPAGTRTCGVFKYSNRVIICMVPADLDFLTLAS